MTLIAAEGETGSTSIDHQPIIARPRRPDPLDWPEWIRWVGLVAGAGRLGCGVAVADDSAEVDR